MKRVLLMVFVIMTLLSCTAIEEATQANGSTANGSTASQATEQPKQEQSKSSEQPKDIILKSGNYVIGTDIPEGVYNLTAISGMGNVDTSDFKLIAILGVDAPFEKEYKNAFLKKGTTLKISNVEVSLKYVRSKN